MGTKSPKMPEAPCVCTWPADVAAYVMDVFRATLEANRERTKDWLTTGEASRRLGLTRGEFRRLCESGRLTGAERDMHGWWRISPEAVEAALERRRRKFDRVLDGLDFPEDRK
jgi:excisionase family DNA binding protein